MSVTDWDSVKPENAFLCASLYSDKIELGFAKQISKMYLGLFYYGDFFTGTNSTYDSVTQETTKQLRGFNRLHILFGIKNWGIQLGYASKSDDDTFIYDNAAPNTLTKQIDSRSWYEFSLDAGTKFSKNDILFKPYTKVLYGVINSFWDRTTDPETLTELNSKLYYENAMNIFIIEKQII